jgi:hypothetical protein
MIISNLTKNIELDESVITRVIVEVTLRLDKKSILIALISEAILINGNLFKIPEKQLLELLINKNYGETVLRLERIE